jgi:hypothetical protein
LLKTALEKILSLQPRWSNKNTPEMKERGRLIREAIQPGMENLTGNIDWVVEGDFLVEASDGIGNKARVPWVRIYNPFRSPKTTQG